MSSKVTIWAWTKVAPGLGPKEGPLLLTLLTLADMARDHGKIWASHAYIATKGRQSPRAVRGNIEELESRGLLRTEPRPGRPDVIWLNLSAVVIFEHFETDEPGALEKAPRRRRQQVPGSEEGASASGADRVGAEAGGASASGADKPNREPNRRTQGEADASAGAGADDVRRAFEIYNRLADKIGTPRAERLNDDRKRRLKARLKDAGGLGGWHAALCRIENSAFLTGQTHHHFRLTLDFLIQPSSFTKLIEGQYEDRPDGRGSPASSLGPDRGRNQHDERVGAMLSGAMEAVNRRRRWGVGD